MDNLNYDSVKKSMINPSLKVFLGGEKNSFLFQKVQETACGDSNISLQGKLSPCGRTFGG